MFTQVLFSQMKSRARLRVLRLHITESNPREKERGFFSCSKSQSHSQFLDRDVSPGIKASACSTKIPSILTGVLNRKLSARTLYSRNPRGGTVLESHTHGADFLAGGHAESGRGEWTDSHKVGWVAVMPENSKPFISSNACQHSDTT